MTTVPVRIFPVEIILIKAICPLPRPPGKPQEQATALSQGSICGLGLLTCCAGDVSPPSSISAAPAAARATSPSSLIKQPETWINLLLTESCLHMEGSNRGILMVHKHLQWISWEDQSTVWMTNEVLPYLAALTFLLQEHLCP